MLEKLLENYRELEALTAKKGPARSNAVRGTVSLRSAILGVLKESGQELSTEEIWQRARERGAVTAARHPKSVVDLTAYQLQKSGHPLEKTKRGTWKYSPRPA